MSEIKIDRVLVKHLIDQFRTDLAAAHAEICKLQGLDPSAHTWPEWSSPANTLRWLDSIEAALVAENDGRLALQ